MALNQTQVSQLYVALFGRASEGEGNTFWQAEADQATAANAMLATSAASTYFGTSLNSNQAFVEHIYLNTLGKTLAQDPDGIAFWVKALTDGNSRGFVVAELIKSATDAATAGTAQDQFNNRVEVSNYMAATVQTAPADYATSTAFKSAAKPTGALDVTNDDATVTTAKAAIVVLGGGQSFTLTTATTDNLVGTTGVDVFVGVNSSALSEGTLQATDKIDGGTGADTIEISMKQAFAGFSTGSMKAVETVKLTNNSSGALSFTATGVTDVTNYTVTNAVAGTNTTLADLATLADVEVSGPTGTSTLSVGYKATSTVATGTQTDVQKLKVTGVGTIDSSTTGTTNAKYMTVDIDKVETLAITTAGTANSLDLSGSADTKTITLAGAGQTEIAAVAGTVTSFDASAATGKVIATITAAATDKLTTVKSGSGDDTVTVALDDLTASATVDMGAGADTLSIATSGAKTIQSTMSNVETIKIAPAGITGAVVFSGTNVTGLTTAAIGAGALGANFSMANMGANALTVNSNAATGNAFSADNSGAITLNYNKLATATTAATASTSMSFANASALTVNVNELMVAKGAITTGTAGALTLNVASKVENSTETTSFSNTITADTASSIVVNATGELINAGISAAKATTATITTGSTATGNDIELQAAKLTSLTITANGNLDMDGNNAGVATTLTKLQTLNATTAGHLDFTGVAMADAATVTLAGTNANSKVTLNNLGATDLTHDISMTATGLKSSLTTGTIDAGTAKVTIDVSGVTGAVTLGTIDGDNGITLNAKNIGGALSNGAGALTTTVGAISVDVSNAASTTTLGALTSTGNKGDVTLLANSSIGAVAVGVITGNNVTINGQSALGTVRVSNVSTTDGTKEVDAKTSFTYTGTNLFDNGLDVHTSSDSTAFTATLNGGVSAEVIRIDSKSAVQTSMTVSGNLGAGTNLVTVVMADNTGSAAADAQTVSLAGLTSGATAGDATFETVTDISLEIDSAITYTGSVKDDQVKYTADAAAVAIITNANAVALSDSTTTDKDSLFIDAAGESVQFTNLSLSGFETLVIESGAAAVVAADVLTPAANEDVIFVNASALSDKAIALSAGTNANDDIVLLGTAGADVIDLSKITDGGTDVDITIAGLAGNDVMVASAFIDTFIFSATAATNGVDTITGFAKASDKINVDAFATGAETTIAAGAMTTTAGLIYQLGGLAAGSADSLTAAAAAITAGATWTSAAATAWVILSDDNSTSIYEWAEVTGAGAVSTELTLVGTIDTAMSTAEIATATLIA